MLGETKSPDDSLVPYGIMEERSDIRAHVGPYARCVFVYRTALMRELVTERKYEIAYACQPGFNGVTGRGWCVPLEDIPDLRTINCKTWRWEKFPFQGTTSAKGSAAVVVCIRLLKLGRFPLWVSAQDDERQSVQIQGTDLVVFARQRIQVKCDLKAGLKSHHLCCSGNLFVQNAERNPLSRH
jgi:hypothetical protein